MEPKMISRIKTDREIVLEAALALAISTEDEFDQACTDMVEALHYARSVQWWAQFEQPKTNQAMPERPHSLAETVMFGRHR